MHCRVSVDLSVGVHTLLCRCASGMGSHSVSHSQGIKSTHSPVRLTLAQLVGNPFEFGCPAPCGIAGASGRAYTHTRSSICLSVYLCLFGLVRRSLYIPVQLTSLDYGLNPCTCTHFFLARDSNPRPSLGRGTLSSRSCSGPCCLPFWTGLC